MAKSSSSNDLDETRSDQETERIREATLKQLLVMPHQPHKPIKDSGKSPAKRGRPKKKDTDHG